MSIRIHHPLLAIIACVLPYALFGCSSLAPESWGRIDLLPMNTSNSPNEPVTAPDKSRVHLFFINGLDPLKFANFQSQTEHVKSLGYENASYGEMRHVDSFHQRIKQIHEADRNSRIVLVGYSLGANSVRTLTHRLKDDGVVIDLLVYLGGDTIKNVEESRPANAIRVLNIMGHGSPLVGRDLFVNGEEITGAVNHRIDAGHYRLPTNAQAIDLLDRHLADITQKQK